MFTKAQHVNIKNLMKQAKIIFMKTKPLTGMFELLEKLFLLSILLDHSSSTFHWTLLSSFNFIILSHSFIHSFHPIITFNNFISSVHPVTPLCRKSYVFAISTIVRAQILLHKFNSLVFIFNLMKNIYPGVRLFVQIFKT